jgi:hypothetical protein
MNNISDEDLMHELFAHRIQFMDSSSNETFIIRKLKKKLIDMEYLEENLNVIIYAFYNFFDIPITLSEIENVPSTNIIQFQPFQFLFNNNLEFPLILGTNIVLHNPPFINNELNLDPIVEENNQEYEEQDNQDYADMPPLEAADEPNNFNLFDSQFNLQFNVESLLDIILGAPLANTFVFDQILVQPPQNNRTFMEDVVVTTDEKTLNILNVLKITKDMNEKCIVCIEDMNEDEEYFDIKCKHIFHKACLEIYLKNYNHICPVCRNEIGESFPHMD